MLMQSKISALTLAVALAAAPVPAAAQLSLGVNLGGNADQSGLGLGVGVDLGLGGQDLSVNAGAGVGGDSLVDANVDLGTSSSAGSDGTTSGVSIDAEVLGDDDIVDADVTIGSPRRDAPSGSGSTPSSRPVADLRISALSETGRTEAIRAQITTPQLLGADLDGAIDDTRVSIVALVDILGNDDLAEIEALVEAGGDGRDDLLAAIEASVELGAILDRNGIALEDVVALTINDDGSAEVIILGGGLGLAQPGTDEAPLVDTDLATLDVDLLTDDELAEIDLALLPDEQQRLDALVRVLGNGSGAAPAGDDFELVAVDALLDQQSLAELDVLLGDRPADSLVVTADLLGALDDAGLSPEAIIGLERRTGAPTRVFVDAGLGESGGPVGDLAQVDLALGTGSIGGDTGTGGNGGAGAPGDGTGGTPGTGNGGAGNGGTGNGGTGNGGTGTVNPGAGGNGGGSSGGSNAGSGGSGNGTSGGTGMGGLGSAVSPTGALTTRLPAALLDVDTVVAELGCATGLEALSAAPAPAPTDLRNVDTVSFVAIEGCVQVLRQDKLVELRSAIETLPILRQGISQAGLALDHLVGGVVDGDSLTLYFDAEARASV